MFSSSRRTPSGDGEGLEVLDGGERVLDGGLVPGRVIEAEREDDGGEGDLLGGLERALDLVHGGDAVGLLRRDEVEVGRDVARPLSVGAVGYVDGLMEDGADVVGAEPGGEFADGGGIGVVEVVARGEDFDGAGTGGGEGVQQARVQAVLEEDVGRESRLHWY